MEPEVHGLPDRWCPGADPGMAYSGEFEKPSRPAPKRGASQKYWLMGVPVERPTRKLGLDLDQTESRQFVPGHSR